MALIGSAYLLWTPDAGFSSGRAHPLRVPLQRVQPAHRWHGGTVYSADLSAQQTVTIGEAYGAVCKVRYDSLPASLIEAVAAGRRGITLTYVPYAGAGLSLDCRLVTGESTVHLGFDEHAAAFLELTHDLYLERTDGSAFPHWLFDLYDGTRGTLFYYRGGGALGAASYSGSGGSYEDVDGGAQSAGTGVLRDGNWVTDETGARVPATRLQSTDTLTWPIAWRPGALSFYGKMLVRSASVAVGFVGVGNTSDRMQVALNASNQVVAMLWSGGSSVASTILSTHGSGDILEYLGTFSAAGVATIEIAVNGGAAASGSPSAPLALPASFGTPTLWLGRLGAGGSPSDADHIVSVVAPGVQTLGRMRTLARLS